MLALAIISCILGSVGVILFFLSVIGSLGGGCLLGFLLLGGHIGFNISIGMNFGVLGVAIFNLVGIILGIIGIIIMSKGKSSSSSSSSTWEGVGNYLHKQDLENIDKYKN